MLNLPEHLPPLLGAHAGVFILNAVGRGGGEALRSRWNEISTILVACQGRPLIAALAGKTIKAIFF